MKSLKFLLLIVTIYSQAQNKTIYEFEKLIPKWQKEHKVPAVAVGLIENGKVIYAKAFGEQRIGIPATDQTIFTVASLTKPIFTMVALNLIEKGELSLEEPLYNYHIDPDLTVNENLKKLNARYVLSHQSGFVNWRNMSPSKKLEFNFEPGSQYLYSGEGFEFLRKALTNKTGKSLTQWAEEVLFTPLGLESIAFTWNPNWDLNKVAYPYNVHMEEYEYVPRTELNAAAGLQTTIKDYAEVCAYVLKGGGLSKSLFDQMITPQVKVKENLYYGLGWEVIPSLSNNEIVIMHPGNENGISTIVILLPKSKKGIVVFTNGDRGFEVYQKVIEAYLVEGEEIFEIKNKKLIPKPKYTVPSKEIENYLGTFQIKENVTFDIVKKEGQLNLAIPGQPLFKLVAQSKTMFQIDEELKVEFSASEKEGFTSVYIYQFGVRIYKGERLNP
ncbi:serine hydrolase domain-containing protein [Aquimarina spongiae]|uniref:CubicO group peptidase, beta-lactamase class C family n=1 Tax=Aquimarina spongiae TaxID=570521 RepID=A0A1M6HDU4_9FLAO|nr:serine hydrolase domain-containing protein [Aquimarina spongiae]SHJ20365.1 CubicO group peptidase, beta-lactamase class C family [Aquimarina spongiae]